MMRVHMMRVHWLPALRMACTGMAACVLALSARAAADATAPTPAASAAASDATQVERGRYLARAGDCVACHTVDGGQPLAGGRAIATPFGTIYTPNLTPDKKTGIGNWSREDFRKAMHEGIGADGDYLYPAFPFPSFTRVTDRDVDAIYAWLKTVKPVQRRNTPAAMSFPYSMRSLMGIWRMLYFDSGRYQPDPEKSDAWNRGAYLVEGLGHCAACHSPRNWLGATKDSKRLAGSRISEQLWYAPNLGSAEGNGLDGWSKRELVDFLHTGRSARGIAYGPMGDVVRTSLQYLTRSDIQAIATYLLERPSKPTPRREKGRFLPPPIRRAHQRFLDEHKLRGQAIYRKHCAACHGKHGKGHLDVYPPLAGNSSILAEDPINAIRQVLLGGFAPATKTYPRPYSMPPFIQTLSDREVADVVTYVRHAWGNQPAGDVPYATVSADTVGKYRSAFSH